MWQNEADWQTHMKKLHMLMEDTEKVSWKVQAQLVNAIELCRLSYQVWMFRLMLADKLEPLA